MEIKGSLDISATQMQARFEEAQAQRMLGAAQLAAAKADKLAPVGGSQAADEKAASLQKLTKVSRDFESIFLGYMLKAMRDTVPKADLLDNSQEHDIFISMHDDEIAKNLSQAGGIGLGKMMVDQLKKTL
jgi:Rod binding domain-containing protein